MSQQAHNAQLITENEALKKRISELEAKSERDDAEIAKKDNIIDSLQSQMAWLRKKLFGRMSEKRLPLDPDALEPTLFDESLPEEEQKALDAEVEAMQEENARVITVKEHKREVRTPVLSGDLPIEETHIYPDGVKDNDDYVEIGVENTDRLAIRPAQMYIERTVRHKFVLKSSLQIKEPERQTFVIAPPSEVLLPKTMASESLLADILINKYVYHLPFYRQILKYKEQGVRLSDATVGDWFAAVCSRLRPLYDRLREQIMSKDYIQVDESTLPVIDNEKHMAAKGYVWVVRDAIGGSVYFHYDNGSRSGDTARRLIGGYKGAVQTDGYAVYSSFENTPGKLMLGCWAHVRRKFVEALDTDRRHASEAIVYISKLYKIEEEMREARLDVESKGERRRKEAYPIIQEFERWLDMVSKSIAPKSKMYEAVSYAYVQLPRLSRYVLDGRYNIDNNGVENAIRPLAIGRKNYLFCGNREAATRAVIVYSLIGSCKAAGVDVRTYLEGVLRRLPTEKDLDALLPENYRKLPQS